MGAIPEPGPLAYVWDALQEIGVVDKSGGAITPIKWQEVKAWSDLCQIELSPDDAALIHRASGAFVQWLRTGEDRNAFPPWVARTK